MTKQAVFDDRLADNWEEHASRDPLWAILSRDEKRGRRWDVEEFFAIGGDDIDSLIDRLAGHDLLPRRGAALDFGCGVGRLTQALADYFDQVVGVDVSSTMIGLATELNYNQDIVRFLLNQSNDLAALQNDEFDFVVSLITLQHIRPELIRCYLSEFLRVLRPGGILVFNLPSIERPQFAEGLEVKPMANEAYRAKILAVEPPTSLPPSTEATVRVVVENSSPLDWEPDEVAKAQIDTHWQAGDGTWKRAKFASVDVGNHWLSFDGANLVNDDGRVALPPGLRAGQKAEVDLMIKSPPEPGVYLCELDVVHERVTWFAQKNSPTVRFPITVGNPTRRRLRSLSSRVLPALKESLRAVRSWCAATLREARRARLRRRHRLVSVWETVAKRLPDPEGEPEPYSMFGIPRPEVVEILNDLGGEVRVFEEDHSVGLVWESHWYFVRKSAG